MLRAKHGNTSEQPSCQVAKIRFEVGNRCFSQVRICVQSLTLLDGCSGQHTQILHFALC